MSNLLGKIKKYWVVSIVIVIVVLVAGYFIWTKNGNGKAEILTIKKSDFIQTVSVSGKVIPAKSVELGFTQSGRVTGVNVQVGSTVGAGQIIAQLDSRNAELDLQNAKIALAKITESSVASETNKGLTKNYEDSLISVNRAFIEFPSVVDGMDSIINNYTVSTYKMNLPNDKARGYYNKALSSFWTAKRAYDKNSADLQGMSKPISNEAIVVITEETYQTTQLLSQATKDLQTLVDYLYNYETDPSNRSVDLVNDRTNVQTWVVAVDAVLTTLGEKRDSLKNVPLDIRTQEIIVAQKEKAYADCFLRAPFSGVIIRLDIKTGEQAIAGQASVGMINAGLYQIESFVPEIYIANLAVGNSAEVTLDAYGSLVVFSAKIISIDPAETIRNGVSTYKTKLRFLAENPRIKPGMTANLLITSIKKPDTIAIPSSAIIVRDGKRFVNLINGNDQITEKEIITGEVGTLGLTEILSGLKEGDQVILNPQAN